MSTCCLKEECGRIGHCILLEGGDIWPDSPPLDPPYTGWAKNVTFGFPLLLDALYLQFLFTHASFSSNGVVLRLPI